MSAVMVRRESASHTTKRVYRAGRVTPGEQTALPVLLRMSRNDLPALTKELGFTQGAEIGVWKGAYSALFCKKNPHLHMLCVDPWVSYPAWLDTKNELPPDEAAVFMAQAHEEALGRLAPMPCTIVRDFSTEAATSVRDGSLDFVYIDGNHTFDAVTADIQAWAPKVKVGGLVAGHDYRHFTHKPTIHVIEAVDAYTKAHGIDPWFVTAGDKTPSWLWVKH